MRRLKDFHKDESGGVAILFALMITVLAGFAGLAVDASLWYSVRAKAQNIADASSLGGALEILNGNMDNEAIDEVYRMASLNDHVDPTNGSTIVNIPPTTGNYAGFGDHVEVIITRPAPTLFSSLFINGPVNIQARAVSGLVKAAQNCILALDNTMDKALEFTGSAVANVGCGIASNSNSASSVYIGGSSTVDASSITASGEIFINGSGDSTADRYYENLDPVEDPYEGTNIPAGDPTCANEDPLVVNGASTLSPGTYCGGLDVGSTANVVFEPGVYILDAGDFRINGGATLSGDGVTFIFTANNKNDIGNLIIAGNINANLIAPGADGHEFGPYEGEYAGMLFIQDPEAPSTKNGNVLEENKITGGPNMIFDGVLYFPSREVIYAGGSDTYQGCLQILAKKVTFTGNTSITNTAAACEERGVLGLFSDKIALVE